jgi:hypothetical protein
VSAVLATSSVVPLLAGPSLRHEQVTQLVLGEGARVVTREGEMLLVRTVLDNHDGWLHRGYVRETDTHTVDAWLATAAWSEGAVLSRGGSPLLAPHRSRLPLEGNDRIRLPDGQAAHVQRGSIRSYAEVIRDAQAMGPADWAWREFAGAPYLWGGVTTAGIDCSGLVQTTFLARGIPLPRDASRQAEFGAPVPLDAVQSGDLLFFRSSETERIAHVAIAADGDSIVHSTVETGQVTREPWTVGSRAAPLRDRLVAVRRLT